MSVPIRQALKIGSYILRQKLLGNRRYPLVLMLEPLFRCNLACSGCGKIDYPKEILDRRLSLADSLHAVDECGAPVVTVAGGEPLLHPEIVEIIEGIVARRKYVYLCTNAILLKRHLPRFKPSRYLTFSVHLDGLKEEHDSSVCRDGVFDDAVEAIRAARADGHRVTVNCTLFGQAVPERTAEFFDYAMTLGVEGATVSPGFHYERAPRHDVFLKRNQSKELFRNVFRLGRNRKWRFNQSSLFLDFLAGNQSYQCTPWGNPCRNIFGWQKPCYLLVSEGYAPTFKALIEETDWDRYGVSKHEKCAQCQMHCGFEPTAVNDTFAHPLKALWVTLRGPRTEGAFARDPAEDYRPSPAPAHPAAAPAMLAPAATRAETAV